MTNLIENGTFIEADYKRYFQFRTITASDFADWAIAQGATHIINPCEDRPLFAKVGKTVAHIIVDENAEGGADWERWKVRQV